MLIIIIIIIIIITGPEYNATIAQVRQALALVVAEEAVSVVDAFRVMAQVRREY
jgi:hypothetical protein